MKIQNLKFQIENKFKIINSKSQTRVLNFQFLDFQFVSNWLLLILGKASAVLTPFKNIRQVSIHLLFIIFIFIQLGCATEFNLATQKEERLMYGTQKEVNIGDSVARKIENHYKINTDIDVNERAQRILERIVAVCDRKDVVYFIKVIDDEEENIINAVSLPGGYIYLFTGLIERVENDDQLAAVIAHEVGHITARHGIKRLQAAYGATLLQLLALEAGGGAEVNVAITSLFSEYSQKDEYESDNLGLKYMEKAGFNPNEMISFLEILKEEHEKAPLRKFSYWRTHPGTSRRISNVNKELSGKMQFKDYLNLINSDDPVY